MGFLARILRGLLWLAVFYWAVWLLRRFFTALSKPHSPKEATSNSPNTTKTLYRDPWCGTHVPAEISHSLEQAGQVLHFCSAECRERYVSSRRLAASG